ncbi:MAG: TonB-dependent receptor [Flavobacteriaceae bacterium]|tara:strand:- start:1249 stop:3405 length:2157 start_codon:yes stop_codon:yes gene_type:complete
MKKLILTVFLFSNLIISQEKVTDTIQSLEQNLDEVIVEAIRIDRSSPFSFSNVDKKDLELKNLGQDLPILLNFSPSVVTTSDAGAGIGYTGIRIRGVSPQSTNITINGIPYNDPESLGTFWVNLPDFTSSVESLQIQRGIGTSTNGSGAFGASINILTDKISQFAYTEISNSFGSYNTLKHTVKLSTGIVNDHFEISGRFSKIDSDGYIDRAYSDLKSYFIQANYFDENSLIKAITFGGHEKTYQSWDGITKEQMIENRRQNPYTYENEIDNYKQDHFQLHWSEQINNILSTNVSLNYTDGRGYFEQYRDDDSVETYSGIVKSDLDENGNETGTTDLIRRRWLDNDFYVLNASLNYNYENLNLILSGSYSNYIGDHFGEVIWARNFDKNYSIRDRYYEGNGKKNDLSFFTKVSYKLKDILIYGDLQFRKINYKTTGITSDLINLKLDKKYNFFNPKIGITHNLNSNSLIYLSYSRANREPSRSDYENNPDIKPEKLNDLEFGYRLSSDKLELNLNTYYMLYNEQLVLTGAIDDVGAPIRTNSGSSYRVGIESEINLELSKKLDISSNLTLSSNKNKEVVSNYNGALTNFGKTNLSYSPNFITNNTINYKFTEKFSLSMLSKYVGKQFMGNTDAKNSILESYFVNDLNFNLKITPKRIFNEIIVSGLINNVLDKEYVSNGYYYTYDDTWSNPGETITLDGAGYYPQATRNFLVGLLLKF